MSRNGKVVVAMSGGVDSSVAACLLKEQGYDPVGVFMWLGEKGAFTGSGETPPEVPQAKQGCCSIGDSCDARAVAGKLGIPFYTINFGADFERIITHFVDEYARARTPNPCVMCNTHVKFGKLLAYADAVEAEYVATGHHARVLSGKVETRKRGEGASDVVRLARAKHREKDQSYALFGIRRENLSRCLLPIGEIEDKAEVRRTAATLGLQIHDKPESQEICFVPNDDYASLVRDRRPEMARPGPIVDGSGKVLGEHAGIVNYTIGQRRGLGVAAGKPIYVTRLDAENNTVVVGPREELLRRSVVAEDLNWLVDPPPPDEWQPAVIQIRYNHNGAVGRMCVRPDGTAVGEFDDPQPAVTPGQAAVFYEDDVVLGGGWIANAPMTGAPPLGVGD